MCHFSSDADSVLAVQPLHVQLERYCRSLPKIGLWFCRALTLNKAVPMLA